jgi:hypothetical protein
MKKKLNPRVAKGVLNRIKARRGKVVRKPADSYTIRYSEGRAIGKSPGTNGGLV